MNRNVQTTRFRARLFEIFISQVVPAIPSVLTVLVWLAIIGGLVWGVTK
jgi:hypothetical protein